MAEEFFHGDFFHDDADGLVAEIADGAKLVLFKDSCVPMAALRAIARRGIRGLHIVGLPSTGLQTDMLIGAGCVDIVESAGVTMGELGRAPCFNRAVRQGTIALRDSTCPALFAGLQAAQKGLPFMPIRGLIGSDLLVHRPDYKVIDNPFDEDDPIVLIPANRPDFALLHVPLVDREGNAWYGRNKEALIMAHAARRTLVTAEAYYDGNLLENPAYETATLPALYVGGAARVEQGAWPMALPGYYGDDTAHLEAYCREAASAEGIDAWLSRHVAATPAAAE